MVLICAEAPFFLSVQMLAAVDDISIASSAAVISHTRSVGSGTALSSLSYRNMDRLLPAYSSMPLFSTEWAVVRAV